MAKLSVLKEVDRKKKHTKTIFISIKAIKCFRHQKRRKKISQNQKQNGIRIDRDWMSGVLDILMHTLFEYALSTRLSCCYLCGIYTVHWLFFSFFVGFASSLNVNHSSLSVLAHLFSLERWHSLLGCKTDPFELG